MTKLMILLFNLVLCSELVYAQNKPKKQQVDPKNKIKKFLQIEDIIIPGTLDEIDFEIRQNTIDVILNSPKYIFLTSKRDKVVNKNYRDYNSLKVELKRTTSKSYVADIHLENWYSAKYDRKFKVILSKYNLLTDLRMGIYELLYGKVYVRKNREKLIQYSAIRIKKIKELSRNDSKGGNKSNSKTSGGKGKKKPEDDLVKEEKEEDQKQKPPQVGGDSSADSSGSKGDEKEKKEKQEEALAENPEDNKNKPKQGDENAEDPNRGKTAKAKLEKGKTEDVDQVLVPDDIAKKKDADLRIAAARDTKKLEKAEESDANLKFFNSADLFDNPPRIFINKKSIFSARLLYTSYNVQSKNSLLSTSLDMSFLRFGATINIIEEKINPISYEFILLAGTSVENEIAQIPAWRTIEARASKFLFSNFLKIGVGVESSPYFFINVPIAGEGQNLYENDIIWVKGLAEVHFNIFRREFSFGGSYSQSILFSSSVENYEASGLKTDFFVKYFFTKKYGAAFSSAGYNFTGTDQGETASSTGTNYSLNFITKFN